MRELAAFIGELALVDYLFEIKSSLFDAVRVVFQLENGRYLGSDINQLQSDLANHDATYDYRWNYPIARILAVRLYKQLSPDMLRRVFLGNVTLADCIELAEFPAHIEFDSNYLPAVLDAGQTDPLLRAFQTLGIMLILDLDYGEGESKKTIENYYATRSQHLQTRTVFVLLDERQRPTAYANWQLDEVDSNRITLKRQSAPFGNHIQLQKKLKEYFHETVTVIGHHERSARKEQVVW